MRVYKFLCFILLITVIPTAYAQREYVVGVSPSNLELGDLERGYSKVSEFFIITPSHETLLVKLDVSTPTTDFIKVDRYMHVRPNYSEEDASAWVKLINNPVELAPSDVPLELDGRGIVRGWRQINFILEIPKNAEPGYHVVHVTPHPTVAKESTEAQIQAQLVSVVSIPILFNVPGEARREGKILDIVSGTYDRDSLSIDIYFKNTGTVTIGAGAKTIEVYKDGKPIATLSSNFDYVKPGETKILRAWLNTKGIKLGDYDIFASVDYFTDSSSKDSIISVYEKPIKAEFEKFVKPLLINTTSNITGFSWDSENGVLIITLEGDPLVSGYLRLKAENNPKKITFDDKELEKGVDWEWDGNFLEIFYSHGIHTIKIAFESRLPPSNPVINPTLWLFITTPIIIIIAYIIYRRIG